jgi:hypothetical protein
MLHPNNPDTRIDLVPKYWPVDTGERPLESEGFSGLLRSEGIRSLSRTVQSHAQRSDVSTPYPQSSHFSRISPVYRSVLSVSG